MILSFEKYSTDFVCNTVDVTLGDLDEPVNNLGVEDVAESFTCGPESGMEGIFECMCFREESFARDAEVSFIDESEWGCSVDERLAVVALVRTKR